MKLGLSLPLAKHPEEASPREEADRQAALDSPHACGILDRS
jgi:hypothetical protein